MDLTIKELFEFGSGIGAAGLVVYLLTKWIPTERDRFLKAEQAIRKEWADRIESIEEKQAEQLARQQKQFAEMLELERRHFREMVAAITRQFQSELERNDGRNGDRDG